jgi:hypothetical protein
MGEEMAGESGGRSRDEMKGLMYLLYCIRRDFLGTIPCQPRRRATVFVFSSAARIFQSTSLAFTCGNGGKLATSSADVTVQWIIVGHH